MAVPLGYRNAPGGFSPAEFADWIFRPSTMPMRERRMGLGRMPTFGFSPAEARQIADWLFTIDGLPGRRGMGMMMRRGRMGRDRGMMR